MSVEITTKNAPRDANELKKDPPYTRGILFRIATQLQLFQNDQEEAAFLGQPQPVMADVVAVALQRFDAAGGGQPAAVTTPGAQIPVGAAPQMAPPEAPVAPAYQQPPPQPAYQQPPVAPAYQQPPPAPQPAYAPQVPQMVQPTIPGAPTPQVVAPPPQAPIQPPAAQPTAPPQMTPPQLGAPPPMMAPPMAPPPAPAPQMPQMPQMAAPPPTPVTAGDSGGAAPELLTVLRTLAEKQGTGNKALATLVEAYKLNNSVQQEVHKDLLGVARMLKLSLQLQLAQLEQQGFNASTVVNLLRAQDPQMVEGVLAALGDEGKG